MASEVVEVEETGEDEAEDEVGSLTEADEGEETEVALEDEDEDPTEASVTEEVEVEVEDEGLTLLGLEGSPSSRGPRSRLTTSFATSL